MSRVSPLTNAIGTARSLSHLFKRAKPKSLIYGSTSVSSHDSERLLASGPAEVELVSMPPVWVDRYEEVSEELDYLLTRGTVHAVKALKEEQRRRLAISAFGNAEAADSAIEAITFEVAERSEKCRAEIEAMLTYAQSQWELTEIQAAQKSAAVRLQHLITAFRSSQQAFHTKREAIAPQPDLLLSEEDESREAVEELTDTQLMKERSKGVDQLLTNFHSLAQIFRELNHLVVQQGNILDRIDVNIELCKEETTKAVEQLTRVRPTQAEKHQNATRATCCLVWLIIGIVVATLLLVFKHF